MMTGDKAQGGPARAMLAMAPIALGVIFAGCAFAPLRYQPHAAVTTVPLKYKAVVALVENKTPPAEAVKTSVNFTRESRWANVWGAEEFTEVMRQDLSSSGLFASVAREGDGNADILIKPAYLVATYGAHFEPGGLGRHYLDEQALGGGVDAGLDSPGTAPHESKQDGVLSDSGTSHPEKRSFAERMVNSFGINQTMLFVLDVEVYKGKELLYKKLYKRKQPYNRYMFHKEEFTNDLMDDIRKDLADALKAE